MANGRQFCRSRFHARRSLGRCARGIANPAVPAAGLGLVERGVGRTQHGVQRGAGVAEGRNAGRKGHRHARCGRWLAAHRGQRERLTVATKLYPPYTPENIRQAAAASAGPVDQASGNAGARCIRPGARALA